MSLDEYYSKDFYFYLDGRKIVTKKVCCNHEYWIKLDDGSWHHIVIPKSNKS